MAYDNMTAFRSGAYDREHGFSIRANLYRRPRWKKALWILGWMFGDWNAG